MDRKRKDEKNQNNKKKSNKKKKKKHRGFGREREGERTGCGINFNLPSSPIWSFNMACLDSLAAITNRSQVAHSPFTIVSEA